MWGRIVSSVSNALDFNQATLSGCIDIICVRNPHTGELHSTPFHVRFGKAKLLRSREKIVSVTVNNKPTALVMKLGAAGEAYFMQEVEDSIGVADEDLASPLSSPVHSPRRACGPQRMHLCLLHRRTRIPSRLLTQSRGRLYRQRPLQSLQIAAGRGKPRQGQSSREALMDCLRHWVLTVPFLKTLLQAL